jgi:ABC-type oligopeptide transport system substrate-binding subunit
MDGGNAQIYTWGWNADYPDPENFMFLLYGLNGKVKFGGENSSNYQTPAFDKGFEAMRNMDNSPARQQLIQQLQTQVRTDAPWLFGFHPKSFALYHSWYKNLKPNQMANNQLKYTRIDAQERQQKRAAWNQPVLWPIWLSAAGLVLLAWPAIRAYRRKAGK